MSRPNISDLIKHLIELEAATAAHQKEVDDRKDAMFVKIISNIVGNSPKPLPPTINDNVDPVDLPPRPARRVIQTAKPISNSAAKTGRGGKRKLSDTDLLNALTDVFQYPSDLVETLATMGVDVSKALVYSRMPKLVAKHTKDIEEQPYPKAWRIKDGQTVPRGPTKMVKLASKARRYKKVASNNPAARFKKTYRADNDQLIAANDLAIITKVLPKPIVCADGLATIYNGDCLEVMRAMPSESIDLIVTSPPYNLGNSSGGGFKGKNKLCGNMALANGYASYDDNLPRDAYVEWQKEILRECWRLLKPTGAIFYNHKPRIQKGISQSPHEFNPGLPTRQTIIWDRNSGFNFNSGACLNTHEYIIVYAKPGFKLKKGMTGIKDIWRINPEKKSNKHPAPFPVALPQTAIQITDAMVVLDPFCGSGTTGVAALREGRQFIGIELDAGYVEKSVERIDVERARLVAAEGPAITEGLHHGDCIELMKRIPDGSVNLILVDPPYGTTNAKTRDKMEKIDVPLDHDAVWKEYRRILTPTGNVVMFASDPYTTDAIMAARDLFKYRCIWQKNKSTGSLHARNQPLKNYEDIVVFSLGKMGHAQVEGVTKNGTTANRMTFNPWEAIEVEKVNNPRSNATTTYCENMKPYEGTHSYDGLINCPTMIFEYAKESKAKHPFQKPLELLDNLVRMYSNAGDVVLDNCVGGGSTAVAAINADRRWIAIEKTNYYYKAAKARIDAAISPSQVFERRD